ncbi:hypothetical protein ACFTS5_10910 [Nocardia sp. NPDC056952]|uniref:hypothetical protein n=1 Tax=Nocardia sp. NPDC056952 TaxID=3345979 RepID=UPI003643D9E4
MSVAQCISRETRAVPLRQPLTTCTQHDIDTWLSTTIPTRRDALAFLTWCARHRHIRNIDIPPRAPTARAHNLIEDDRRWTIVKSLLHDQDHDLIDRVAGCLVLMFAQPATRIVTLTVDHITDSDATTQLQLGAHPVDTPDPLADLLHQLSAYHDRGGLGHSAAARWLFPGSRAGQHRSPANLNARLTRIGIDTRAGRSTALIQLAAQLPAVVLGNLLGLHIQTATRWTQAAGNTRPAYAADVSRRPLRRS